MERLHSLTSRFVLIVVIIGGPHVLAAQAKCSLTVKVLAPNGERPHVSVQIEERSGRRVERFHDGADVQFCDLGALPVTVKVGADGTCDQVVVRDVPLKWDEPYVLVVTWQFCECAFLPPPVPFCRAVFRVSDGKGHWVPEATIKVGRNRSELLAVDQFGRASIAIGVGESIKGVVSAPGFNSSPVIFSCTKDKPVYEVPIRLAKRSPPASLPVGK